MKYKMVNEELQIASVCLAELTVDEVRDILQLWEDGVKIGTLTLFYNSYDGILILNQDNPNYETYLNLAEAYLAGDYEIRKKMVQDLSKSFSAELEVLEKSVQCRAFNKRAFRAIRNDVTKTERLYLDTIIERYNSISAVYIAYKSGVIKGKKAERAKRKRGTAA